MNYTLVPNTFRRDGEKRRQRGGGRKGVTGFNAGLSDLQCKQLSVEKEEAYFFTCWLTPDTFWPLPACGHRGPVCGPLRFSLCHLDVRVSADCTEKACSHRYRNIQTIFDAKASLCNLVSGIDDSKAIDVNSSFIGALRCSSISSTWRSSGTSDTLIVNGDRKSAKSFSS